MGKPVAGTSFPSMFARWARRRYSVSATRFILQFTYIMWRSDSAFVAAILSWFVTYVVMSVFPVPVAP